VFCPPLSDNGCRCEAGKLDLSNRPGPVRLGYPTLASITLSGDAVCTTLIM
ncbi:Mycobacterium rhizamassiliense ORFan, partial [Mycobacterium rhizamassiliense]